MRCCFGIFLLARVPKIVLPIQSLEEVARIALVTVEVEGYLTHGRLSQLCERHPHDLSRLLAHLVEEGFLESDKRGRGTSYRFPGTGEFQVDDSNSDGSYSPFLPHPIRVPGPHLTGQAPHIWTRAPCISGSEAMIRQAQKGTQHRLTLRNEIRHALYPLRRQDTPGHPPAQEKGNPPESGPRSCLPPDGKGHHRR